MRRYSDSGRIRIFLGLSSRGDDMTLVIRDNENRHP
jgi:hypothetical protein